MFAAISTSVLLGWLRRRVLDWGGWIASFLGAVLTLYGQLPPEAQHIVLTVLSGNWKTISLGAAFGLVSVVYSQIKSYQATAKPQIVAEGKQIALPTLTLDEALAVAEQQTGVKHTFDGKPIR